MIERRVAADLGSWLMSVLGLEGMPLAGFVAVAYTDGEGTERVATGVDGGPFTLRGLVEAAYSLMVQQLEIGDFEDDDEEGDDVVG